jgi:protocatechuate 3,4-dioxygenase beta subunit
MDLPLFERADNVHPPVVFPDYRSNVLRAPRQPLVVLPQNLTEVTAPVFGQDTIGPTDGDLTRQFPDEPLGQRIIVHGHVLESNGRPVPNTLVEIWQANASGRYRHVVDNWPAPLDPNFSGAGRALTDAQGHYSFTTIQPGAYPWGNHDNAWRPAHIHFSVFGRAFTQRLVTQMYFPGDPLLPLDPIFNSIPDIRGRELLISRFDLSHTQPNWALAFEFDILLRGERSTPFESGADHDD